MGLAKIRDAVHARLLLKLDNSDQFILSYRFVFRSVVFSALTVRA